MDMYPKKVLNDTRDKTGCPAHGGKVHVAKIWRALRHSYVPE